MTGDLSEQIGRHVFTFLVPLEGETVLTAVSGTCTDEIRVRKVEEANPDYVLPGQEIVNWLDREVLPQPEGYCSIYDTVGTICGSSDGIAFMESLMQEGNGTNIQVPFDKAMRKMMKNETLASIVIRRNDINKEETLKLLNRRLNRIAK